LRRQGLAYRAERNPPPCGHALKRGTACRAVGTPLWALLLQGFAPHTRFAVPLLRGVGGLKPSHRDLLIQPEGRGIQQTRFAPTRITLSPAPPEAAKSPNKTTQKTLRGKSAKKSPLYVASKEKIA